MTDPQVQKDPVAVLAEALRKDHATEDPRDFMIPWDFGRADHRTMLAKRLLAAMPDYILVRRDELRGGAEPLLTRAAVRLRHAAQYATVHAHNCTVLMGGSCRCGYQTLMDEIDAFESRALLADTPAQSESRPRAYDEEWWFHQLNPQCTECGQAVEAVLIHLGGLKDHEARLADTPAQEKA